MASPLIGPWGRTLKTFIEFPKDFREARRKALLQEGQFFRDKIVEGLREQAPGGKQFVPLSPLTLAMRKFFGFKGTKALIAHADLRNSIKVQQLADEVFVGILRTAKNAEGHALVDVAAIQEEGSKPIVIKMTPKMAALLHAAFRAAGIEPKHNVPSTGVIIVRIPARPFFGPVFEKYGQIEQASERFAERFRENMKGKGIWGAASSRL